MEYGYVVEIKNKKLAIKNLKYYKKNNAVKIINYSTRKNFYNYKDLATMQNYELSTSFIKHEKKLSTKMFEDAKKNYCQNLPLWILEYKEIFDLIKDNLYAQYLPNSRPLKINQDSLETYLPDINVASKKTNIEGKLKKIIIKLDNKTHIQEAVKKNGGFNVDFVVYDYVNWNSIASFFGVGVINDGYLINDQFKKILKPDPRLKNIKDFFDYKLLQSKTIDNPVSISLNNLLKLFKKFKNELSVVYGMNGTSRLRYIDSTIVNDLYNHSQAFTEKLLNAIENNNKLMEYQSDLYIIDDDLKEKTDAIFERLFNKDLKEFLNKIKVGETFKKKDPEVIKTIKEIDFRAVLYPHQEIGVSWLYNLYKKKIPGALLADDMGLGKTSQTIATLALIQSKHPNKKITIISPASMVGTWQSEIEKFYPDLKNVTYMSYEKALRSINSTDILVLDEAQKIKNHKAETYKMITSIKKEFTIILTGTPIENKIDDIINILGVIDPLFLKLKIRQKKSQSYLLKLKEMINPIYLQRKKVDLNLDNLKAELKEIPEFIKPSNNELLLIKSIREIYLNKLIQLEAKNNYEFYESQIVLTGIMRIRQAISYPNQLPQDLIALLPKNIQVAATSMIPSKFKKLQSICKEKVQKKEKLVIFSEFRGTIDFLKKELSKDFKVATLVGSDSSQKRKITIDSFQDGLFDIIIVSLKAGNSGITLHNANNVIIYDLWFNPQVLAQAIARVHRIGQQKDVEARFLVLEDTFDRRIYDILYKKKKLIENFENYNPSKIAKEMAEDYFKSFKKDFKGAMNEFKKFGK